MDLDRLQMQGKLAGLKEQRDKLSLKIEGLCASIRSGLNTMVVGIDDLDVAVADQQMSDLLEAYVSYVSANNQIQRLERALHG